MSQAAEIDRRIVLYGPQGSGKTTCLDVLRPFRASAPRLLLSAVSRRDDATADRRRLVKDCDGVLFVADSDPARRDANVDSMTELLESLRAHGREPSAVPMVLLCNKRDLPAAMAALEMQAALSARGDRPCPCAEGVALRGIGVEHALQLLLRRLLALPDDILWERTGDPGVPYRALAAGKRLYVKLGEPPAEPLYTLILDGEPASVHDEWPTHWILPRVRVAGAALPLRPPSHAPSPPATAVASPRAAPPPRRPPDRARELEADIARDPTALDVYRHLHRHYLRQGQLDEAWCVAAVMVASDGGGAQHEERMFAARHVTVLGPRPEAAAPPEEAPPLERIMAVLTRSPAIDPRIFGLAEPDPGPLQTLLLAGLDVVAAAPMSLEPAFVRAVARTKEILVAALGPDELALLRGARRAFLAERGKTNLRAWLASASYFRLRRQLGLVLAPAPTTLRPDQRIFVLNGTVRLSSGHPAGIVAVSAVIDDEGEPNLVSVGLANNDFYVSFTREAFDPEGTATALPEVDLVFSVPNRAEDDVVPVLRYAVDPLLLRGRRLGTIVLPLRKGDRPSPPPGLVSAPGQDTPRKRLRLDDWLVATTLATIEPVVTELTGWTSLSKDVRLVVVDDFIEPARRRYQTLFGKTSLDARENALLEHVGRGLQPLGLWDEHDSVIYLNRPELESQSLGLLLLVIGHELVHVGQSRNHPELDEAWRELAKAAWTHAFAGRRLPNALRESLFGHMANVEGYASYIERTYLKVITSSALALRRPDVVGPEAPLAPRAHDELDVIMEPEASPSLRSALLLQKWAQYDSGRRSYAALASYGKPPRFDPRLRPEPILPEEILKPLVTRALGGHTASQLELGDIYRTGGMVGVTADRAQALRWYRLAEASGSEEAAARLEALMAPAKP